MISTHRLPQFLVLSLCAVALGAGSLAAGEKGFQPLFNGKDLSGWEAVGGSADNWKVEDGLLICTGEKGSHWLSTTKEYANFELHVEFKVPPGGNSGVFLRSPREGNGAFDGMEIQILDDYTERFGKLKPTQYTGSLYDVVAAEPRVTKQAGEWQTMDILCDGDRVKVTINGTVVVDTKTSDHPDSFEKHPGLKRTSGYIGLQNHSSRLDFRKVEIRELP